MAHHREIFCGGNGAENGVFHRGDFHNAVENWPLLSPRERETRCGKLRAGRFLSGEWLLSPGKKHRKTRTGFWKKGKNTRRSPKFLRKKPRRITSCITGVFPGLWKTLWKMWKTKWEKPQFFCVRRGKPGGKGEKLSQKPSKTRKNRLSTPGLAFWPVEKTKSSDCPAGPSRRGREKGGFGGGGVGRNSVSPVRNRLKKQPKHDRMGKKHPPLALRWLHPGAKHGGAYELAG